MLDKQLNPKSSEGSFRQLIMENQKQNQEKKFFDSTQDIEKAVKDFDVEGHKEEIPFAVKVEVKNEKVVLYLMNARILMRHHEYQLALNLLRQASNLDSKNPKVLSLLAQCLDKFARNEESLIVYKNLVAIEYCFENLFGYANVLYKLGRDQEALEKYFEALSVLKTENENLFELYKNMGNIFVRQGDFEAGEEYYNKAYTLNTQSESLLVNFGTLEVQRNDFDKALYCFRKAVEFNPESDKAWVGLAMVHSQLSDIDLAWANLESALEINPKNHTAVLLAANWGHRDNKLDKAINAVQNLLGNVEEDEDMSLVLINLFCAKGQFDRALLEIERVLAWNPDQSEVRELKVKLRKIQKDAEKC